MPITVSINPTLSLERKVQIALHLILSLVYVNDIVLEEVKRIIRESEITKEDDKNWPQPDKVGRQELEIVLGNEHISFTVR